MQKFILSTLLIVFCFLTAFAQETTISGVVTSSEDGSILPGVGVSIKGTTKGTVTDMDGKYSIKAKTGAVLVFSFFGFINAEKAVRGRSAINIALKTERR